MTDSDRALTRRALQAEHAAEKLAIECANLFVEVANLRQLRVPEHRRNIARIEAELRAMDSPDAAPKLEAVK